MTWEVGQTLYRAEANTCGLGIVFRELKVERLTPRGAWLSQYGLLTWRSFGTYYVSATKDEAKAHLVRRKQRHVQHARRRLADAEKQLEVALEGKPAPKLQRWRWDSWSGEYVPDNFFGAEA